jgi:predicted transcriptional regulator
MPIGIVSDDDFMRELGSFDSTPSVQSDHVVPEIIPIERPGRKEGDVNIPDALRQIIGEESVLNGRKAAVGLAGMFGISESSVSAYAKGTTSTATYDKPKSSIIQHINKSRARASKKASKVLDAALGAITQDKLDYTDAKDLSAIAKDMSVIIKNLEPPADQSDKPADNTPQFVIFAPQFRDERSFDHITVNE